MSYAHRAATRDFSIESLDSLVISMKRMRLVVAIVLCFVGGVFSQPTLSFNDDIESEARLFLVEHNQRTSEACYESMNANWNYATNINSRNERIKLDKSLDYAKFNKESWKNITSRFKTWRDFKDPVLLRIFQKLVVIGSAALPESKFQEYEQLKNNMSTIYSTTKICDYHDKTRCDLPLDPDVTKIMKESRDERELRHVWTEWHDKSGGRIREYYEPFVEYANEVARLSNYSDAGTFWLREYESETFKDDVEKLWQTLKPLYQEIHAYVRAKLRAAYSDQINQDGLIPAHLLGNMWAQSWENIYSLVVPFPEKASIDVTEQMKQQGFTPLKMFQVSDEFFTSLGLVPMPNEFWRESVIEKPPGREMVCHASAWDFCNGRDFRIKQCTVVSTEDLITVHHEMGHVQYYLQYKGQPHVFRRGANPGFHEAVGDTLALSVTTPKHLKEIGLLDPSTPTDDYETSINFLLSMALEKIAFLPFGYLIDKYRWDIFDGTVNSTEYNAHWWKLRREYQGIKPPVERTEEYFDAGAKYHVPANVEYLRYFVSTVIQFQFHRSLCQVAGQYDAADPLKPLHNCDIYRSKAAGSKLAAGLTMGSSRPWPEVMEVITGQDKMDASAIREYFKPLEDWLIIQNGKIAETPGWQF